MDHGDCAEWFRNRAASLVEAKGLAEERAERDRETEKECEL
jgi:hypothetical protein